MGRAVIISDNVRRIKVIDRQLVGLVDEGNPPPQPIPCEDLDLIAIDSTVPVVMDTHVLRVLAETQTALIITDRRHIPIGISLPFFGTLDRGRVLEAQFKMSVPRKKQLWQQLVKAKIINQAANISDENVVRRLKNIARSIKSGDSNNDEAVAAKLYWQALVDFPFHRQAGDNTGLNSALNFIYAIVRSLIARTVTSAGIEPSLSIFHSNRVNPFALIDDLMEPFRPIADRHVLSSGLEAGDALTVFARKKLIGIMSVPVQLDGKVGPLAEVAERFTDDVKRFIFEESNTVAMPTAVDDGHDQ